MVSVSKEGKDSLKVTSFELLMDVLDTPRRRRQRYACEGFNFNTDCKAGQFCTHVFRSCRLSKFDFNMTVP